MKDILLLAADQQEVYTYECLCFMIDRNKGNILLLDAPGGTGKTFLTKFLKPTILTEFSSRI